MYSSTFLRHHTTRIWRSCVCVCFGVAVLCQDACLTYTGRVLLYVCVYCCTPKVVLRTLPEGNGCVAAERSRHARTNLYPLDLAEDTAQARKENTWVVSAVLPRLPPPCTILSTTIVFVLSTTPFLFWGCSCLFHEFLFVPAV